MIVNHIPTGADRGALRRRLLAERERFVASPDAATAGGVLAAQLVDLLKALEPGSLGVYWSVRSEFNAAAAVLADKKTAGLPLALPFARRAVPEMAYRRWDGAVPSRRDEVGIPTGAGAVTVPEVVLVPCVGFTADGFRLGYGGGYFDRWLASNPGTRSVGVAYSVSELPASEFTAMPHDRRLTLVVTERGVVWRTLTGR